ncbi:hypothetical protein ABZ508_17125 [Streptomyces lavendulocolor]|uniref:Uncharacterized protein n=1 Tax=Streptomyces lavendulocolor TaxID=67316 RepID=A0ABV2W9W0_9ACTN
MTDDQDQARGESYARLVELKLASVAAQAHATAEGYSEEAWSPWRQAAEEYEAALAEHAAAFGLDRDEVDRTVTAEVLHPRPNE